MAHYKHVLSLQTLGTISLVLGFVGALLYWWFPAGAVVSITGLLLGFIGIVSGGRSKAVSRLLVAGMVVCLLALILDCVVAGFGGEVVKFHALR